MIRLTIMSMEQPFRIRRKCETISAVTKVLQKGRIVSESRRLPSTNYPCMVNKKRSDKPSVKKKKNSEFDEDIYLYNYREDEEMALRTVIPDNLQGDTYEN